MSTQEPAALRVVAVGVGDYENLPRLPEAEPQAAAVAAVFGERADAVLVPAGSEIAIWAALQAAMPPADQTAPPPIGLIVYWAGHGYLQERMGFCLAAQDSNPAGTTLITADKLADFAARTHATQILMVIDACFAGAGIEEAMAAAVAIIKERRQFQPGRSWFGVIASAMDWEQARDNLFGPRFLELLSSGPTSKTVRDTWSRHEKLIHAEDLIQALSADWPASASQRPDALRYGELERFIPNPLFVDPGASGVAAQLLDAALGGEIGDGGFFTGRTAPLAQLVALIHGDQPGLHVLTGPPGCGKSAVLGWLVCRSDPTHRDTVRTPEGAADPGVRSIQAGLVARGLSAGQLLRDLDLALSVDLLPADRAGQRGIGELLDAIGRTGRRPVVVVDGLDEAGVDEAGLDPWTIAQEVLRPLATVALVIVGTRDLMRPSSNPVAVGLPEVQATNDARSSALVATLVSDAERVLDLLDLVDEEADIHDYVASRLAGLDPVIDPGPVADYINETAGEDEAGRFLFARLLTDQLRDFPVDLSAADWRDRLADSVEESFDATIAELGPLTRAGGSADQAAAELLTALAWAAGSGMPDDVWAKVATALSISGTAYARTDVAWALRVAGRFVVEDGNGTQAVYRLAHQQLVDHLLTRQAQTQPPEADTPLSVASALAEMLSVMVAEGRDLLSHTYLWQHAWQHCAQAGPPGIDLLEELEVRAPGTFTLDLALALDAESESLVDAGEEAAAIASSQRAADLIEQLDDEDLLPTKTAILTRLALLYGRIGPSDAALQTADLALAAARDQAGSGPASPTLASSLHVVAIVRRGAQQPVSAITAAEESVAIYREIVRSSQAYRVDLAAVLTELGMAHRDAGHPDEALRTIREATLLYQEFAETSPDFRSTYATSLSNLGLVCRDAGRPAEALQPARDAVALNRTLAAESAEGEPQLAVALSNLGMVCRDLRLPDEAVMAVREAVELYEAHAPTLPALKANLLLGLNNLAVSLRDYGQVRAALDPAERAVELSAGDRDDPVIKPIVALTLANTALIHADLGEVEMAISCAEEAMDLYDELTAEGIGESNAIVLDGQARTSDSIGQFLTVNGRAELALPFAERAVELFETLAEINRVARPAWYIAQAHLGIVYNGLGQIQEAARWTQTALVNARSHVDAVSPDLRTGDLLAALAAAVNAATLVFRLLDAPIATTLAREAVDRYRELCAAQPVYRSSLVESQLLYAELVGRAGDLVATRAAVTEAAHDIHQALGDDRADVLRTASALARLVEAAAGTGHPDLVDLAAEAVRLTEPLPGAEDDRDDPAVRVLRAVAMASKARAELAAGHLEIARVDAQAAVDACRALDDSQNKPGLLTSTLILLAQVALAAGDRAVVVTAAREAIRLAPELKPTAAHLTSLALATTAWAQAADEPDTVWAETYADLLDDGTRIQFLMIRLQVAGKSVTDEELIAAEGWAQEGPPVYLVSWREWCRRRRAADPAAFDARWHAARGAGPDEPVPVWLTLTAELVTLVTAWMTVTSIPDTYEFHRAHLEELSQPGVVTLLEEFALANPAAPAYLDLVQEVAEFGVDEAYLPFLFQALLQQLQGSDPAAWPRLIDEHRDLLVDAELVESAAVDLEDADPSLQRVASILVLAAHDLDRQVFAVLEDPADLTSLLAAVDDRPELAERVTSVLLEHGQLAPAELAQVQFARTLGLAQLGRRDEAFELATEVAQRDPGASPERLQVLMELSDRVVGLRRLMEVFGA